MSNEIFPGRVRPTRKDVATLANVSGTTVSRVLGGRADEAISSKVRERVLKAARELGYTPNSAAKALRSGRTGLIGFWMNLEYSLYRGMVLAQMRKELADTEYALAVTDVDEDFVWHHSFDRSLRVPVEGIIAFDASTAAKIFAQEGGRLAPNVPFVTMGAFWAEERSYVAVDLKAGVVEAVEHLLATGRRQIAHIAPAGTWFMSDGTRFEGYREAVEAAGYAPQVLGVEDFPPDRVTSSIKVFKKCLEEGTMPDAVVCFYDDMAVDAMYALQALGLKPGIDVALVGVNGTFGLEKGPVPMTTVRQPIEEMCALALRFLRNQIDDPTMPLQQRVLKPELVIRASSDGSLKEAS